MKKHFLVFTKILDVTGNTASAYDIFVKATDPREARTLAEGYATRYLARGLRAEGTASFISEEVYNRERAAVTTRNQSSDIFFHQYNPETV